MFTFDYIYSVKKNGPHKNYTSWKMTRSKKPNEMRRDEKKTSQWFSFEMILVIAHCANCNFYV